MIADAQPIRLEIAPRRRRIRRSWRRAVRAMRELVDHPDRTYLAFDVALALDPQMAERGLGRMLAHPEGRRVYDARPCLRERLSDLRALEELPEGSFGRAYRAHVERYALEPTKLVELGEDAYGSRVGEDAAVCWARERQEMAHDLWHVLTGYGADGPGESALLFFSLAQVGGYSNLLLAFGANARMVREHGPRWIPHAWRAWRRGRRAKYLGALPYEELLPLPLGAVRAAAGLPVEPEPVLPSDPLVP